MSSWLGLASVPGALEQRLSSLQQQELEEDHQAEDMPDKPQPSPPKKSLFEVKNDNVDSFRTFINGITQLLLNILLSALHITHHLSYVHLVLGQKLLGQNVSVT
jgi:hypothetical protein